jgi:hypothetical protein
MARSLARSKGDWSFTTSPVRTLSSTANTLRSEVIASDANLQLARGGDRPLDAIGAAIRRETRGGAG